MKVPHIPVLWGSPQWAARWGRAKQVVARESWVGGKDEGAPSLWGAAGGLCW